MKKGCQIILTPSSCPHGGTAIEPQIRQSYLFKWLIIK